MATDAERIRRAAARYGRTLDPIAARYTDPLTGKRLSGEALILKTVEGESRALSNPGGARKAKSSAGAIGWAQFMPATRAGVIQKYGVDPWRSPEEAVHALTLHMRGKLGNRTGLEGYNPGSSSYPSYILGQKVGSTRGRAGGGGSRSGGSGRGGHGAAPAASTPGLVTTPGSAPASPRATSAASGFQPGGLAQGLQAVQLDRAPQIQTAGPQMPGMLVPKYYTPVPSMGPPQPPPELDLSAPAGQEVNFGGDLTPSPVTARGPDIVSPNQPGLAASGAAPGGSSGGSGRSASGARVASGGFPTAKRGKYIGTPHAGTHTLGNWQSDNAVDISVPVGTPMVAMDDGVVVKVRKHPQGVGRFAGDQITIRGRRGNSYFYAHGKAGVKPGQRVKRGQSLGTTGSANGVPHLHIGVQKGDPRKLFG